MCFGLKKSQVKTKNKTPHLRQSPEVQNNLGCAWRTFRGNERGGKKKGGVHNSWRPMKLYLSESHYFQQIEFGGKGIKGRKMVQVGVFVVKESA